MATVEHADRGTALLAVMLAQLSDDNSVSRILLLYNELIGQETTSGKLKRLIEALIEQGLVEREQEKMLGTVKVSFHRILPLGELAAFYFIMVFILDDPFQELEIDIERFQEIMKNHDSEGLVSLFLRASMQSNKILRKYYSACRETKNLERMKLNPLEAVISSVLGGKTGTSFKLFEELLSDYLQTAVGLTRKELTSSLETNVTKTMVEALNPLIQANQLGKTAYYRLDRKGIAVLPLLVMLVRELAADPELIKDYDFFFCPSEVENAWSVMVRNARAIFNQLYLVH